MRRSTRIWIGSSPSSMADRLNWSYGRPGKGLIDGMGNVHTWQTNPAGRPHHNEYADNQNVGISVPFQIEPDGYIHDDPFGALTAQQVRQIIHADPNLHQQGSYVDDDWTLDDQIPGVQTDESSGAGLELHPQWLDRRSRRVLRHAQAVAQRHSAPGAAGCSDTAPRDHRGSSPRSTCAARSRPAVLACRSCAGLG
jgi:hypothetical protein